MIPVKVYPAQVFAVNGSPKGPYAPGASSTFRYTLDVTMDDSVKRITGCAPPAQSRWPDTYDMWPHLPGSVVFVYRVGDKMVMKDPENVPATAECPP
jgi:hypothetical protein